MRQRHPVRGGDAVLPQHRFGGGLVPGQSGGAGVTPDVRQPAQVEHAAQRTVLTRRAVQCDHRHVRRVRRQQRQQADVGVAELRLEAGGAQRVQHSSTGLEGHLAFVGQTAGEYQHSRSHSWVRLPSNGRVPNTDRRESSCSTTPASRRTPSRSRSGRRTRSSGACRWCRSRPRRSRCRARTPPALQRPGHHRLGVQPVRQGRPHEQATGGPGPGGPFRHQWPSASSSASRRSR